MPDRDPDRLFHIVARGVWDGAVAGGWYRPESLTTEGFVHLSYADQVLSTANRFYRDLPGPLAVEFSRAGLESVLGSAVVDEDTYCSGQDFPHLYGPLPTSAASTIHPLNVVDGSFVWSVG